MRKYDKRFEKITDEIVQQELSEFNAIGAGGVAVIGGLPLGINMSPQHKTMWSGNKFKKTKKKKKIVESPIRSHMSKKAVDKIFFISSENQPVGHKPKGFWFDCDGDWVAWVRKEMPSWEGKYVYQIEIDESKILRISTFDELLKFTKKYGISNEIYGIVIDWPKVAQQYSGIEICPYIHKARLDERTPWYYTWDVASGCIWDKSAIKSIKLINEIKESLYSSIKSFVYEIVENVLDDMGHHKVSKSIRDNMIGGGEVYVDKHDQDKKRTKNIITKISKNLHKKPYSHDPPSMGLGENLFKLLEGKIDQAIEQYSFDEDMSLYLSLLKQNQVKSKFVPWLIKIGLKLSEEQKNQKHSKDWWKFMADLLIDLTNRFDEMVKLNQISTEWKDINKYQSIDDLTNKVKEAEDLYKEKSKIKTAKKAVDKIYEDSEYLIIEPKTKEASCIYGKGTKWCISATKSENYFEDYHTDGIRFLFIINKKTGDKDAISFIENVNVIEIYDANNNEQDSTYIENKYKKSIIETLNNFLFPLIKREPFLLVSFEEIKKNPFIVVDQKNYKIFKSIINGNDIRKAIELLEILAYDDRSSWLEKNNYKDIVNARIREGLSELIKKLQNDVTTDTEEFSRRLLKIYKTNPKQFAINEIELKILSAFVLARSDEYYLYLLLPLVLNSENIKKFLTNYLNDKTNISHLEKIILTIKNDKRIPDSIYFKIIKYWQNKFHLILTGDFLAESRLKNLKEFGDRVNWNFIEAALNMV